ncbi:hypothetical protein LP418_19480 [Nocardioides sp. B-3]|nr:hypothetical protein [Nocardioides sp. B-3]UUZ58363.1 hypothetical protein LP418_19480 [Nocardioides sp. B-3]
MPAHSPVVAPARAAAVVACIRFLSVFASAASVASAAVTAASSRWAFQSATDLSAVASACGSAAMIASSRLAVSGEGSVVSNLFTPTTISSPASIRARRAAWALTSACFM